MKIYNDIKTTLEIVHTIGWACALCSCGLSLGIILALIYGGM